MNAELEEFFSKLSSTQIEAANWEDKACLVLAGPGVGKTTVLTARIARILDESRKRHFKILALTFTTKAADEMRRRIEAMVPGLTDRATVGTFHSFCAQILRLHGSHIGIKSDFGVYDQDADRLELLKSALSDAAAEGLSVTVEDARWLKTIDELRSKLVGPSKTAKHFADQKVGERIQLIYGLYENALMKSNVMDFNGLILGACRLFYEVPAVAARLRQTYPFWLIDEFQDTSPAQYRLVKFMAGNDFKNVFAVADDDQIIYQFAGASYRQLEQFRKEFSPNIIQLVENRRCPPAVVKLANALVANNTERTPGKSALIATKPELGTAVRAIAFDTDQAEAEGVAEIIAKGMETKNESSAVIGRTRAILQPFAEALKLRSVPAVLVTRRDRFISPQFVWLQSVLDQTIRPSDRRIFVALCDAANRVCSLEVDPALSAAEAEGSGLSFLQQWVNSISSTNHALGIRLADMSRRLLAAPALWEGVMREAVEWLPKTVASDKGVVSDADDDKLAWESATHAIKAECGPGLELAEFLQCMALRPKEPPVDPKAIILSTIHSAKGLEFDHVWVVGLADSILPSWQSLKSDARLGELEEERRNCFVAITRPRKTLTLTRAMKYRGWTKQPSRFLAEMGLTQT